MSPNNGIFYARIVMPCMNRPIRYTHVGPTGGSETKFFFGGGM